MVSIEFLMLAALEVFQVVTISIHSLLALTNVILWNLTFEQDMNSKFYRSIHLLYISYQLCSKKYSCNPGFNTIATNINGCFVVGNYKGEARLFNDVGKKAKNVIKCTSGIY